MLGNTARPSLSLAWHDEAQREQIQPNFSLHPRKRSVVANPPLVSEVVATITVAQLGRTDPNVNTITAQSVLTANFTSSRTNSSNSLATAISSIFSLETSMTLETSSETIRSNTVANSKVVEALPTTTEPTTILAPSLDSTKGLDADLTFIYSRLASPSSQGVPFNSNTLIPSSSSPSSNYINSSIIISSSTRFIFASYIATDSTSASSDSVSPTTKETSISFTPISSSISSPTSDSLATTTQSDENGQTTSPEIPSSTIRNSNHESHNIPPRSVLIGSVVGSVAGAALLIVLMIILLRLYKKNKSLFITGRGKPEVSELNHPAPMQSSSDPIQRQPRPFPMSSALSSMSHYRWPSAKVAGTTSSTDEGDQGFYRISGRKLPSVLHYGGDGYGGGSGSSVHKDNKTVSGPSLGRDSPITQTVSGSPSRSTITSTPAHRENGTPVARSCLTLNLPQRPDAIGRSHPSLDGSHTSRFTEEV
ncbi:BgTH12-02024 [Blumeria graminis f. sp. triticale]|uniref:BgTH12-02024 n=1 Tax=Blumeria graminis f. sp. triticale TaxID=1689686 RepID=A0A9W4CZJ5_BLUGR|nr:hypothetical protein BGT96224_A20913 [Blumeria graminis f. sp. tritici 96224]CAD6501775.1 BgTH12-02024 [Blumeria graminis f. sp. triticale]